MTPTQFAFNSLTEEALEIGKPQHRIATQLQHWRCHIDSNNVQWWCLDQDDTDTNKISQAVINELRDLVYEFKDNQSGVANTQAIVIRSLKDNGFAAGADINEFKNPTDAAEIAQLLSEGREVLAALEQLSVPTIALLHGFCMGGGLEVALACRYRIARPDTLLGFPEVNLGLHPGLGGTVRLTRQIDATEALKMMLTGKPVPAGNAQKLGLVNVVGEEHHFYKAIEAVSRGKVQPRGQSIKSKLMNQRPAIKLIARQSEKQTRTKANPDHYPAPFALIDLYRKYGHKPDTMYLEEGKSFADLLCGNTSKQLVRVFFLREGLKAKTDSAIKHVHVVGAGTMGGDIAAWCALRGLKTTVEDKNPQMIAPALKKAAALFDKKCKNEVERRQAGDRFIPDSKGYGRGSADLIIEAVPEKMDLKTKLLRELEVGKKPGAILATNTSSLLLQRLRESLKDSSCFVGVHFFNPVDKMPLVEVVCHDQLSDEIKEQAQAFVSQIGRLPIAVKSAPGFLVNRVLTPYLLEALALLDEGASKETVDSVAEQFGMPMGPIQLADFIGLDICLHVASTLSEELEQAFYRVPPWFKEMVENNALGVKTGRGFYQYDKHDKPKKGKATKLDRAEVEALQDRLILPLLNTCVHCLDEGIVSDVEQLDAAVIFATGFSPFTGGPLQYAKDRGVPELVEMLKSFTDTYADPRFSPAAGWQQLVDNDKPQETTGSKQTHAA